MHGKRRTAAEEDYMPKRKVLIPLDGSEYSRQIIAQLRKFLAPDAHELVLLRVSEPPRGLTRTSRPTPSAELAITEYESESDMDIAMHPIYQSQKMEAAIAALTEEMLPDRQLLEGDGYAVGAEVRFGHAAHEILGYASEAAVDLIAMTTHGRTGLQRLVEGSVASDVLHQATVPLLLYRPT
jgi:nucleotide-binding universal stress UspA family protein